jgi:hypothetical protein
MYLYGIYACLEDNIIYTTFIWELIKLYNIHCIPSYYRDAVEENHKVPFEFVKWEYRVDFESPMLQPFEKNFVRTRSAAPIKKSQATDWQWKHRNLAGLFRINSYQDIVDTLKGTFGDACSELNFFALGNTDSSKLTRRLNSYFKPDLYKILDEEDVFIHLLIGFDLAYYSCITIKSKRPLGLKINLLTDSLSKKVETYQNNIAAVKTIDEFLSEMRKINAP